MMRIELPIHVFLKTPIAYRFLLGVKVFLALFLISGFVQAQTTAHVEDAVLSALNRPEVEDRLRAQVSKVRAEVEIQTILPNPSLEVEYNRVFGDINVGVSGTSVFVEQRFDVSDWRSSLRSSLPHREAALDAELKSWKLQTATVVRRAFFRVRYFEERIQAIDAWMARLDNSLQSIRAREIKGDASLYHVRRIQREIELAKSHRAAEVSKRAEAWDDLERWVTWEKRPKLLGDLHPSHPTSTSQDVVLQRPDLAKHRHIQSALRSESRAWGSSLWRGWSVGAGYQYAEVGPSTGHGFLVKLSLPLAFWDTNAPRLESLRAQSNAVNETLLLKTRNVNKEIVSIQTRLSAVLQSLEDMPTPTQGSELTKLAQVAFDADEISMTELLDAFESETVLQLARLELQWEVRRITIDLNASRGLGVPQ